MILDYELGLLQGHCEIRRGRWFEEHAHHSTIKILVRYFQHGLPQNKIFKA
jgi:hypothetical protein